MKRRRVCALATGSVPSVLAGCLTGSAFDRDDGDDDVDTDRPEVERREFPEWPDDPSESNVTAYAAEYKEVDGHNQVLDRADEDRHYVKLSYSCAGAFEAETSAGYVVLLDTFQTSIVDTGSGLVGSQGGSVGRFAALANEDDVIDALIPNYMDAAWGIGEPPYSTRGLVVVNFSSAERSVEIAIENESADAADPDFEETYDLDAETGASEFEAVEEPGSYTVSVTIDDNGTAEDATHDWDVPDEPREWTEFGDITTFDVSLGVYVLPDETVEIRESPDDRTTVEW